MIRFGQWFAEKSKPAPQNTASIERLIEERLVHIVYQPIVDLQDGEIFAYEALARGDTEEFKSPLTMLSAAVATQNTGRLGRLLRELTIEGCTDTALFVNIHPNEFAEGWLVQPTDPLFMHPEPVYIEITESVPLSHFEQCHTVLDEIRSKNINLAIDDLGAGFSNLKYITDLSPQIVKLDRELISGIQVGTRQYNLLRSMVQLCENMGARVVAEGIETQEELGAVMEAGTHFGQGYYLARPAFPPPPVNWPKS